jgi:16S rRNA (guanine(527)-N(7))-methyltransferase RsmG
LKELEAIFINKKFIEVIDIGTGNGTPGIPWAIAKKEINISLVEKNQKKTAFLHSAIQSLELNKRAKIYNKRFEDLAINKPFDVITSRALMSPESFVNNTFDLRGKKTVWLIMTTNEKMEFMKDQFLKEKGLEKVLEKTYEIKYGVKCKTSKKPKKKIILIQNQN